MQADDLKQFVDLVRKSEKANITTSRTPAVILSNQNGTFAADEFRRLCASAEMAFHAGEVTDTTADVARTLSDTLREGYLYSLTEEIKWIEAISSALASPLPKYPGADPTRAEVVGRACNRIKAGGRQISIQAFGPEWKMPSFQNACRQIDVSVSRLGGRVIIDKIGALLQNQNKIFEGVWLFGDTGLSMGDPKNPAIPYGWLLGLAAKHAHRKNKCRKPEVAWRSLIENATDIAASFDCQRYSQFEGMNVPPLEISRVIEESVRWRGLFFTPQMPNSVLKIIQKAFESELRANNAPEELKGLVRTLWQESTGLIEMLTTDHSTVLDASYVRTVFPKLAEHASSSSKNVNSSYLLPISVPARSDTQFVFLQGPEKKFLLRPLSMTAQAVCETIFTLIWKTKLLKGKQKEKIVGDIMERCLADACEDKADIVRHGMIYNVGRDEYEVDVAARTGNRITLIETKSKPLTAMGQVAGSAMFYQDYAKSYLPMLKQLLRHEKYVKEGQTELLNSDETVEDLRIEKIAVSPVSFGPVGDRMLTTHLHSAFFKAKVSPVSGCDEGTVEAVADFNKALKETQNWIIKTAPRNEKDKLKLTPLFLSTHWLDLGQCLFAIKKAGQLDNALKPIRHLSYQSRDFWTEYAFSSRMFDEN